MGNGMNKVLPGLYLGSFRDGKDPEQLQNNKITHIVSIHDTAKEVVEDRKYLCIRVPDSPDENLTKYFSRCNDFIHSARMGGGNVLIHCLAGVSRSATIAAAYIMSVTSLNCKDSLKVIRGARDIANPNYGFHSQLKDFESYALTSERKRIKLRYSAFDNQKLDEEECSKLITVYQSNIHASNTSTPTSTPTHTYRKRSFFSAHNTPVSSPLHRYRQKASRSATSSPKRTSSQQEQHADLAFCCCWPNKVHPISPEDNGCQTQLGPGNNLNDQEGQPEPTEINDGSEKEQVEEVEKNSEQHNREEDHEICCKEEGNSRENRCCQECDKTVLTKVEVLSVGESFVQVVHMRKENEVHPECGQICQELEHFPQGSQNS